MNSNQSRPTFKCPACRARQPPQSPCRRCGADLSLVVAARQRIDFLQKQIQSVNIGSPSHQSYLSELEMLSPKLAKEEKRSGNSD